MHVNCVITKVCWNESSNSFPSHKSAVRNVSSVRGKPPQEKQEQDTIFSVSFMSWYFTANREEQNLGGFWARRSSSWWILSCDSLQMSGRRVWLHLDPRDYESALLLSICGWRSADITPALSWHLRSHFFILWGTFFSHNKCTNILTVVWCSCSQRSHYEHLY